MNNREVNELARLILFITQRGMQIPNITYPYDFSDREAYQRRSGQRAPYGL
jgi:hypothetical protein